MGFCSATDIFDEVAELVLVKKTKGPRAILKAVAQALEGADWDCQSDSRFWKHPEVKSVMKALHPDWELD